MVLWNRIDTRWRYLPIHVDLDLAEMQPDKYEHR